jgi:hypothetical protein
MGPQLRRLLRHEGSASWPSGAPAFAAGAAIVAGILVISALTAGGASARGVSGPTIQTGQGAFGVPAVAGHPGAGHPGAGQTRVGHPGAGQTRVGQTGAARTGGGYSAAAAARSPFRGIVLPDLLVVAPAGLTSGQIADLRAIKGVRKMITFDGAQITVGSESASVIGVSPAQFRSWVPLRTASDQALWSKLAAGDFIAASSSARRLGLTGGSRYQLTGAAAVEVPFGGAAPLGIAGVDLLVNQGLSGRLGLVHQVAALISAPGPSMTTLTAQVSRVLGAGAKVVGLRGQQLPVSTRVPNQMVNYLQLFQAAAARYCPSLSWTVLAAIGQIESADGQNVGPSSAGALGPMQFMPGTWAAWGIDGFGPAGPPDVMNPFDAVPSAARMLCADGAASGTQAGLRQAIFAYNHADWYVNEVLALAAKYAAEYR